MTNWILDEEGISCSKCGNDIYHCDCEMNGHRERMAKQDAQLERGRQLLARGRELLAGGQELLKHKGATN